MFYIFFKDRKYVNLQEKTKVNSRIKISNDWLLIQKYVSGNEIKCLLQNGLFDENKIQSKWLAFLNCIKDIQEVSHCL